MKVTTKIAKNGAQLWYVNGKRVSRETAQYHEYENERYQEWLEKVAMERLNAAIDDYAVTVEAQDAAVETETEQATATNEEKAIAKRAHEAAKLVTWDTVAARKGSSLSKTFWYIREADGNWKRDKRAAEKILAEFGFNFSTFKGGLKIAQQLAGNKLAAALQARKAEIIEADVEDYAVTLDAQDSAVDADDETPQWFIDVQSPAMLINIGDEARREYEFELLATFGEEATSVISIEEYFKRYGVDKNRADTHALSEEKQIAVFEVGKTYAAKKTVLFDSQTTMTVIKRTNNFVQFQIDDGELDETIYKRKVVNENGVEKIYRHETNALGGDFEFSAKNVVEEKADDTVAENKIEDGAGIFAQDKIEVDSPAEAMALIEVVARDEFEFYRETDDCREFRNVHNMEQGYGHFTFSEHFTNGSLTHVDLQKGINLGAKSVEIFIKPAPVDNFDIQVAEAEEIDGGSAFDLLPTVDELNDVRTDIEKEFDEYDAKNCDRNDRFNRGERHAEKITAKLREFDPTVEVTYDIDEYGEDVFFMTYEGIYGAYCYTLAEAEEMFHSLKKSQADPWITAQSVNRSLSDDFARKVRHHKAQIDAAKFVIAEAEETIHESEYYLQVLRDEKAAALGADFNKIIGERTIEVNRGGFNSDRHVISKANPVFVDADYPGFKFRDAHGRQISDTYDLYYEHETAAQIETVIEMLKAAIERGDTEFTFPTVEELNAPDYDEKKWAVDFDIYHADGDLSEEELQGYTYKLRAAMTANGNRACVKLEDCVIVIYGDDGGDNDGVEKLVAELEEHDCLQEWAENDEDENEKVRLG